MKRLLLLTLVVASAVFAWATGLHEKVGMEMTRELVHGAGAWGPLLFIVLFGLEGLGVPGVVFMVAAIAIWPPSLAFLYNFLGAQMAGLVGFGFARWVGREWVAERLPDKVRRYEARIEDRGLATVIVVRLVFFLAPPAHWLLGLSPVRFRDYLLGTAIGMLPWLVAVSYGGSHALRWLADQPPTTWMMLTAAVVASVVAWRCHARWRHSHVALDR